MIVSFCLCMHVCQLAKYLVNQRTDLNETAEVYLLDEDLQLSDLWNQSDSRWSSQLIKA